jgi:hypothetical protein
VVETEQLSVLAFFGLIGNQFVAQFVDLLAQFVALAFGVEGVADAAEQVPHRLESFVGAVLDRRDNGEEGALHRVQPAAVGLAEVSSQEQQ